MYSFILTYGSTSRECYPRYDSDLSKVYEERDETRGKAIVLDGNLTFVGEDFTDITAQAFGTKFTVQINRGVNTNYYKGYFYIQDAEEIDLDMVQLTVSLTSDDEYTNLLESIDTRVRLSSLSINKKEVFYNKSALYQIYATSYEKGDDYVLNMSGNTYWDQNCTPFSITEWDEFVFNANNRTAIVSKETEPLKGMWIAEEGDLTQESLPFKYYRSTGYYYMERVLKDDDVTLSRWLVKEIDTEAIRWTSDYMTTGSDAAFDITRLTFTNVVDPLITTTFDEERWVFTRVLCDEIMDFSSSENYTTFCENEQYTRQATGFDDIVELGYSQQLQNSTTTLQLSDSGKYFVKLESLTDYKYKEVGSRLWGNMSLWVRVRDNNETQLNNFYRGDGINGSPLYSKTSTKAHSIPDIINALLDNFNIDLTFKSEFFTDENNPITGVRNTIPMFTDITNMLGVNPAYNNLATDDFMSIGQLLKYLNDQYNVFWDISDGFLRAEHTFFYDNGNSYTVTPGVNINLTELYSSRTSKVWSFGVNKLKYDTSNLYKTIYYTTPTQSDIFSSSEINSDITFDETKSINISEMYTDIAYLNGMSQDLKSSLLGFAVLHTVYQFEQYEVLIYPLTTIKNQKIICSNIYASLPFCTESFAPYNFSTSVVNIDGASITTKGFFRPKIQTITYPLRPTQSDIDVNKLITTELGNGFIRKNVINLTDRYCTIELEQE